MEIRDRAVLWNIINVPFPIGLLPTIDVICWIMNSVTESDLPFRRIFAFFIVDIELIEFYDFQFKESQNDKPEIM